MTDAINIEDFYSKPTKYQKVIQAAVQVRDAPFKYLSANPKVQNAIISSVLFILYNLYLGYCIVRKKDHGGYEITEFEWCDGLGFLIIITALVYLGLLYFQVLKPYLGPHFENGVSKPLGNVIASLQKRFPKLMSLLNVIFGLVVLAGILTFLIIDSRDEPERLMSALGVVILVLIGFIFSAHPAHIRWRSVFWGLGLEFTFGLLVLRWETGATIFQCIGDKVTTFLGFTSAGSQFVFGFLSDGFLNGTGVNGTIPEDLYFTFNPPFMFKTLSVIYFFSFCVSMMFYLGALQWIVLKMGWLLSVTVGTTAAESLNAAANIFLGQTEAPLLIKPFLPIMTKSEIHAVMTGGFATIAGTVLAAFINFGIKADLLIAASVMAAPTALAVSKLFYPELEKSKTTIDEIKLEKGQEANILDAASQGASTAIMLVLNIAASLIAFLSFVAFIDTIIGWMGILAGIDYLSFNYLLGKLFIPIAYIMGVPSGDTEAVAELIGIKTVINEFAAFENLGKREDISERGRIIATYALCGFANPSSIGIQLGGLGAMAPERKQDLAQVVFRAFVAGCFTSFINACMAGALISTTTTV